MDYHMGIRFSCLHDDNQNTYFGNTHHYPLVLEVCVDIINTDLVMGMECGLCHKVDILLFNPPYVPTPPDEGKISLS